jgi:Predicted integral membrane protein
MFSGSTLISADDTWVLMAITLGWVALSIYLEQTYEWASKLSGAIIALIGALLLTNFHIIPTSAPFFDTVIWGFAVPMAIPLLLLQCNMKKIWRDSGRLMIIFLIGSVGTVLGAIAAFSLLHSSIPWCAQIAGMMTGSYIGGGVNFAALANSFDVPKGMIAATTVADNLNMAIYFFVLMTMPTLAFFRKHYKHPHVDAVEAKEAEGINEAKTLAAAFWGRKEISLRDIAVNFAISGIIVMIASKVAGFFAATIPTSNAGLQLLNVLLGNQYLIITILSMILATYFSKSLEKVAGSQEIGTYLIYLFFFAIGVPASIVQIFTEAPLVFVLTLIMVIVNMVVMLIFGKLLHFNLEEIIIASNANIGGPTTAAAMAISKGWTSMVAPAMLVGVFGYVIGTPLGIFIEQLFS